MRFAPTTLSFMELRNAKDLAVAGKLYGRHSLLGTLGLRYSQEFNMTSDSGLWKDGTRRKLEATGLLAPGEDSRDIRVRFRLWKAGWAPLMEGKHFWQFNPYYLGNDTENGLKKFLEGQKFLSRDTLRQVAEDQWQKAKEKAEKNDEPFDLTLLDFMPWVRPRSVFRRIARSSDQRTLISSVVPTGPIGEAGPHLTASAIPDLVLSAQLSSLTLDWVIRRKVSANLSLFFIETLPIPAMPSKTQATLALKANSLMGVDGAPIEEGGERLRLRLELDALVAHAYGLTEDAFAHILLDTECGAVGFGKTDPNLPIDHRQPRLTLDAYRQLLHKGLDRFLQDGAEIPEAALAHRRPLIEIWSPADGWDTAWAEAEAMADSDHEWDLFLGKEHAVQAEYGNLEGALDMAASPEHGKDPYRADPQPGALFDTDEFRRDGQRRLL
jgi:hypothetical protein